MKINQSFRTNGFSSEHSQPFILFGKFTVPGEILATTQARVDEILPYLDVPCICTPADLLGQTYWRELREHGQRIALLCLQHLAEQPASGLHDIDGMGQQFCFDRP